MAAPLTTIEFREFSIQDHGVDRGRLTFHVQLTTQAGEYPFGERTPQLELSAEDLLDHERFQARVVAHYGRRFHVVSVDTAAGEWEARQAWRKYIAKFIDSLGEDELKAIGALR
jgi:hypothetical protein